MTWVNCERSAARVGDARRPVHHHRVAGAAQMRADLLAPFERRIAGPGPRGGVVGVHHRAAPRLDAAVALGQLELHLVGERDAVLHRHLVERAGDSALHAGAVVTPDPDDQRVVQFAELLDCVNHPPDVVVCVFGIARVDLHLAGVIALQPVGNIVPSGERVIAWGEFRVRRDHAEPLLPGENLLAKTVPPLIELALVLIGPRGGHVVRGVATPGGEVGKERLAGVLRPDTVQPLDCLVGHRIGQVVRAAFVVEAFRGADDPLVLGQARIPLPRITAQEAIEIVEAPAIRPPLERPGGTLLAIGRQMPFAERCSAVSVLPQNPRQRRTIAGHHGRVPGKAAGKLADRPEADRMIIPPSKQRRPRRRTQRGHMETVVAQPAFRDPRVVRGIDRTTERARVAEASIVDQHQ